MTKINTTDQTLESIVSKLSERLNTIEKKVDALKTQEEKRKDNLIKSIDLGPPDTEEIKERVIEMAHELVNAFFFLLEDGDEEKKLFIELMNRFEIWRSEINKEMCEIKNQLKNLLTPKVN